MPPSQSIFGNTPTECATNTVGTSPPTRSSSPPAPQLFPWGTVPPPVSLAGLPVFLFPAGARGVCGDSEGPPPQQGPQSK